MLALLFLLMAVITVMIWAGKKKPAIWLLLVGFIASSAVFFHDISTHIHLNL